MSPIRIKNPNYGSSVPLIVATADTKSRYINVPCGVCGECLAKRQMDLVQRMRVLALDHYIFFCTLTYSTEMLPVLCTSKGVDIPYADHQDVIRMIKRIRQKNLFGHPFKYYFVTERGSKRGRPHVHGLIFVQKSKTDDYTSSVKLETRIRHVLFKEWRRNYGSDRCPDWKPLFQYHSKFVAGKRISNFDCHYVTPHSSKDGEDDVAFYVSKYVLKPSKKEQNLQIALKLNYDEDEFRSIWKVVKSRSLCSKFFGSSTDLEISYIKGCISRSESSPDGFKYFALNGSTQPLSRYYRRYITPDNAEKSVAARGGPITFDDRGMSDKDRSVDSFNKIRSQIGEHDLSDLID